MSVFIMLLNQDDSTDLLSNYLINKKAISIETAVELNEDLRLLLKIDNDSPVQKDAPYIKTTIDHKYWISIHEKQEYWKKVVVKAVVIILAISLLIVLPLILLVLIPFLLILI
ncbi:hypothetical protein KC660_03030 [Candidatus Dojkabacteria bacterium]|uniref:Uncharacterized protein n=1 Tax=Candidatus Dojkabacteria bacterium TaxID=2099670 RepID=A0A955L3Y4_9BACT|nr:hypothetical protein [Candidatus Dojkabacteria bacterium]